VAEGKLQVLVKFDRSRARQQTAEHCRADKRAFPSGGRDRDRRPIRAATVRERTPRLVLMSPEGSALQDPAPSRAQYSYRVANVPRTVPWATGKQNITFSKKTHANAKLYHHPPQRAVQG